MSDTVIEAAVQVGVEVTRYLRCGRGGRATLVIADTAEERTRLLRQFSGNGCVVAPVLDGLTPAALAEWMERRLPTLIEGLGLDSPRVVVSRAVAVLETGPPRL